MCLCMYYLIDTFSARRSKSSGTSCVSSTGFSFEPFFSVEQRKPKSFNCQDTTYCCLCVCLMREREVVYLLCHYPHYHHHHLHLHRHRFRSQTHRYHHLDLNMVVYMIVSSKKNTCKFRLDNEEHDKK